MAEQYSFVTNWELEAPLEEVWNAIYNSLEWPKWWKGVERVVEIKPNDPNGVNGIRTYTWRSALPYRLTFSMQLKEREFLKTLKGVAFGELEGTGEWFFKEHDGVVHVQYNWNIITHKKWMNTLAFILKPIFKFNHDIVMHWGGKGLAKKLQATLLRG